MRSCEILIVDDEIHICNALRRILRQAGYKVKAVNDGNAAVDILSKKQTDVVLLDLMMPGVSGREICSIARFLSAQTRVIYFSALSSSSITSIRDLMNEADGFIRKPATAEKILAEIRTVLNSPYKKSTGQATIRISRRISKIPRNIDKLSVGIPTVRA